MKDNYVLLKDYSKMKMIAKSYSKQGNYEKALKTISLLAEVMYNVNAIYCDDDMESLIEGIVNELVIPGNLKKGNDKDIIFYDGFGLETRGLALIYLRALISLDYRIIYVTLKRRKGKISLIEKELQNSEKSVIEYISTDILIEGVNELNRVIMQYNAPKFILYTTPYDMIGIPVSVIYKGKLERYLVNLTDHAFWLGKKAMDYCIEFRDYGASVSVNKRMIDFNQIIKLPYYPLIDKEKEFEGFPFDERGKKVVFSGGSLYKTLGANNIYYKIVDEILKNHKDVIFLYAGSGEGIELNKLIEKYPERVYWINERRDLYQIMKHSYLYLSTYPMVGGLMTQYAVSANTIPVTLVYDACAKGVLLDEERLDEEFYDMNKLLKEINLLLSDETYLQMKKMNLKKQLVSEKDFTEELGKLLVEYKTKYNIKVENVSTQEFQNTYLERLSLSNYYKLFGKRRMVFLLKYFPKYYILGFVLKIKERLCK